MYKVEFKQTKEHINMAFAALSFAAQPVALQPFDAVPTLERVHRFFSRSHAASQANAFQAIILDHLRHGNSSTQAITLADRFLATYYKHKSLGKIAKTFDRALSPYRPRDRAPFQLETNQERLQKWCEYGMDREIYLQHPEFCDWMESSRLLSQMKVTHRRDDVNTVHLVDSEPAIFVTLAGEEGRLMKWSELERTFDIAGSDIQKEVFLCHKKETTTYV